MLSLLRDLVVLVPSTFFAFLLTLEGLFAVIVICKSDDEPNTTVIFHETRTEMTVEDVNNLSRTKTNGFFDTFSENEGDGNDLEFDYDDDGELVDDFKNAEEKEQEMQEVLLKAMRKPAIKKQIGEVIPILRVMSPAQRLTLAALVSSQIMSQHSPSESNLTEIASLFAGKNLENADDRHNITEHLLLPISMDIAKMFKGLGKEMGRNLRQNFYKRQNPSLKGIKYATEEEEKENNGKAFASIGSRRMDENFYDESEEKRYLSFQPKADAFTQPGKDECDYFTKNLCLEVTNYPTEAIISSLQRNQDIAMNFLTDFEIQPNKESKEEKNVGRGRRLERREDIPNNIRDPPESEYMCPSSVKYARPKRARTTSGNWKYVVNAGDYTQTLRLEICQKPNSPCSYVTNHLNSQCSQVYNYHRLLTWDENKGLHMDIFKVPSCCSCHIKGYSTFYPPNEDFTYAEKRKEPFESPEFVTDAPKRPNYNSFGIKREVSNAVLFGGPSNQPAKNVPSSISLKEFPVDHLVPPGPPLPLENEEIFNSRIETKYSQKKGLEPIRRHPEPSDHTRIIHKAPEKKENNESFQNQRTQPGSMHDKISVTSHKLNFKIPQTHTVHTVDISSNFRNTNPIFDSSNQIHYPRPTATPITLAKPDLQRGNPNNVNFFVSSNSNNNKIIVPNNPKVSPKPHVHFLKSEFNDINTLPSRVNPLYVTPPKEIEVRGATISSPIKKLEQLTSSGQRKINYNYHPIIDFFIADSKKRQATYSEPPPYLPLASQDWTPVIGH